MAGIRIDLLRHWAIFVAVAEEQHFGAAADRLGMSQPSVSQGLRRLEDHVDLRLIDRGGRAVAITAEGRRVLPLARTLLRDAHHLAAEVGRIAESRLILDCGVAASLPASLMAAAVSGLASAGARVEMRRAACSLIVDAVGTGELACGIVEDPTPHADLARGKLHEFPRALLEPAGSAALERSRITWPALSGRELVTLPRPDGLGGKTGTAEVADGPAHGWFAGIDGDVAFTASIEGVDSSGPAVTMAGDFLRGAGDALRS